MEVEEVPQRRPIQRQRSWGKNPYIVERTSKTPLNPGEGNNPLGLLPSLPLLSKLESTIDLPNKENSGLLQENPQQRRTLRRGQSAQKLNVGKGNDSQRERQSWKRRSEGRLLERRRSRTLDDVSLKEQDEDSYEDLSSGQRSNPQLWKRLHQGNNPLQEGLSLYLDTTGQPLENQPLSPRYQSADHHTGKSSLTIHTNSSDSSEEFQSDFSESTLENTESQGSFPLRPLSVVKYEENRGDAPLIRIVDKRLYGRDPRVVVGFGILGSLIFGGLPPTAMTGVNVNVTGYYFDIPPGEWLSDTLVTAFMTTFTLALLTEGYEWGQTIGGAAWNAMKDCYSCYTGKKENEDVLSAPLVDGGEYTWAIGYKKSLLYYGVNG